MSDIWERAIQEWYEHSRTPNLEYLDIASTTKATSNQLAHNLAVIYDRMCLSSKVHLKNFKLIKERYQTLEREVSRIETSLRNLTIVLLENRPLTIQEVRKLVAEIAKQPKLVEEKALKLTEVLNKKLERVENILQKIERWTVS